MFMVTTLGLAKKKSGELTRKEKMWYPIARQKGERQKKTSLANETEYLINILILLFKDCLKVKKDMEFKFIWTLNGKIFMRKDKDKDSAVHHINNKEDLQKIQTR